MRAGIGLTREFDNGSVFAADLGPVGELAAVNIGDLLQGQFADRVLRVHDHRNGIARDDVLHGFHALRLRLGNLFILDLARCIRQVHGAVEQRCNARARAAARHRDAHIAMFRLVCFRPRQRQVDDGIRTFIFDVLSGGVGSCVAGCGAAGCEEERSKN